MQQSYDITPSPWSEMIPKREVAHRLGVSEQTVSRWIGQGRIPGPVRLGYRTHYYDWNRIVEILKAA